MVTTPNKRTSMSRSTLQALTFDKDFDKTAYKRLLQMFACECFTDLKLRLNRSKFDHFCLPYRRMPLTDKELITIIERFRVPRFFMRFLFVLNRTLHFPLFLTLPYMFTKYSVFIVGSHICFT